MMNKNTKKMYSFYVSVLALCMVAYIIFTPISAFSAIRILSKICAGTILLGIITYVYTLFKYKADAIGFAYICLLAEIIMAFIFSPSDAKIAVPVIGFMALPTLMIICHNLNRTPAFMRNMGMSFVLASVFFAGHSLSDTALKPGAWWPLLLGYNNPNTTAVYLFLCLCGLVYFRMSVHNFWLKRFLEVDVIYIAFLLSKTMSRTPVVVLALIIVMYFFISITEKLRLKGINFKRWCIVLSLIAPALFVLLALGGHAASVLFRGEDLFTGREYIYWSFFSNLSIGQALFGDLGETAFYNMHNGYIAMISTVGILGFIPYIYILICSMEPMKVQDVPHCVLWAQCAFMGILIYLSTESALFTGGQTFTVLVGLIYILAIPDSIQNSEKVNSEKHEDSIY